MSELKFMVAPSGAGKSTWVNNFIKENKGWVAVSRDKLREQLFSYTEDNVNEYYSLPNLGLTEKLITDVLYNNIKFLLSKGLNVIIDNTNLKMRYINPIIKEFPESLISFQVINTTLEECIERNNQRKRKVDRLIIYKQYEDFKNIVNLIKTYE